MSESKIVFHLLKKKDIRLLQNFIHKYWKHKHIISLSKKLLLWQYGAKNNKINFYACKKENNIIAILGFTDFYPSKYINKKIGLAIWSSIPKEKNLGALLFYKLLKKNKNNIILGTGLNKFIIKYYKNFAFKVRFFNKYYICPRNRNRQIICKNLTVSKPSIENYIKTYSFRNLYKILKNNYEIYYIKKRFEKHPFYKHFVLKDTRYDLWFIARSVKVGRLKFLRILDYYGNFEKKNFEESFSRFCLDNNYHHTEFMHYGDEKIYILKSGFKKANDKKNILPILCEPFIGLKNSNIRIAFKNFKKIKIVKGDVDADRPNLL